MALLRQRDNIGRFGSLKDAMSRVAQDPSALLVSRNTFHDIDGNLNKRRGYEFHGEVGDQAEPYCAPVVTAVTDAAGELWNDTVHYFRVTYVTAAGETDDLHSSDPTAPGPAVASVEMTGGNNAADVEVPFHLKKATVTDHEWVDDTTVRFKIDQTPVEVCDPDIFIGWLVYSRSPRIQDETHLGFNCGGDEPLYHRHEKRANGILGKIAGFDPVTGWWTLDRGKEFGAAAIDENLIDIMMPDRQGLPIRYFNVYISTDNRKFYHAGVGVDGTAPVRVYVYDDTLIGAPSTRFPRLPPVVTAVDVEEASREGKCGEWPVLTNIEPGIHMVRITFMVDDADVLRPPGLVEAQARLGEPEYCYPFRCSQESFPSCAAYVCVSDGQGILVQPQEFPDDEDWDFSFKDWRIYTTQVQPICELTMAGGVYDHDLDSANDNERPYAWYFPDRDLAYSNSNVQARLADLHTFPPLGTGDGSADESGASNSLAYEQFRTGPANACISPGIDPFEESWYQNRPSYEDVLPVATLEENGYPIFTHCSTRDDSPYNRMDFNFWLQQCEDYATATHAVFAINMRCGMGYGAAYSPATAPDALDLYFYDYDSGSVESLKSSGWTQGVNFRTYYFCVEDPVTKSYTLDGENYISFFFVAEAGVHVDVREVYCWLYSIDTSCGEPLLELYNQRGVYGNQTSGGDPEDFGAWYSGDTDSDDATIEAGITAATIDTILPDNARNAPLWEEYGNSSQVPTVDYDTYTGNLTMGAVTPGEVTVAHTPDLYPYILYGGFAITGYTSGVDYTFDAYSGVITSITIPDTTVIEVTYELPIAGQNTSTDDTTLTDGWTPSYHDVLCDAIEDPRCEYDYTPLWASTRQDVAANRHHWWFRADDGDWEGTPYQIRVEITFRTRDGGSGGLGAWSSAADTSRKIRLWDDAAYQISGVVSTSWIDLQTDIGGADILNTWVTRSYAIPWSDIRRTFNCGITGGLTGNHKYFILDMAGWDYNGFDVACIKLFLDTAVTDAIPSKWELLRDIVPRGTETWTLKNPLLEKSEIEWTGSWGCADAPVPVQGEWVHLRRNTTGQWPVTVRALPIVYGAGNSAERLENFIGCGDSFFLDSEDGTLERVYHVEGQWHGKTMTQDWRFTNYLSRCFAYNPGFPRWNLRFDGVQTWPMGIGWPYTAEELSEGRVDDHGNYDAPPEIETASTDDDPCLRGGEQPILVEEDLIVDQTDTAEGETPMGSETPVVAYNVEYYIVWRRTLKTGGRSYIVRSRPRLLTETVNVRVHEDYLPVVRMDFTMCPEPQVTQIEIYRNLADTAQYYRVAVLDIDDSRVDAENGVVRLRFEDEIPVADSDLGLPMLLETGRPRAARLMEFFDGRNWIVPQEQGDLVEFTNVNDPAGAIDPEGYWPLNSIDPPMREAAAITCLSVYHSVLLAHSRTGIVAIRGLSDDINDGSAISAYALHAHTGFCGPDAYCVVDSALIGMSHEGPLAVLGDEGKTFGTNDIDFDEFELDPHAAYNVRCVHNRSRGLSQVWFTYSDDPMEPPGEKVLVFDKDPDGSGGGVFWKKWDSMQAYGLTRARGRCGDEYPLMGNCQGRLFDYGFVNTDAGVFIESEFVTGWYDEAEIGRSHQPDFNYWRVLGSITDWIFLDVHRDGTTGRSMNEVAIPINMGGLISNTEEKDEPEYTRRTWDQNHVWGDGGIWRVADKDYDEQRTHHAGVFRMIQYRLYQTRELLPAGVDPGMTYVVSGFIPFHRLHAPTPANAGT